MSQKNQETGQFEKVELSEREIALAQGKDPDEAVETTPETVEPAAKADPAKDTAQGSGTDADNTTPAVAGRVAPAWIKDTHLDHAASYGLTKDDLEEFGDEESYRRTTRLLDKQNYLAGQQASQAERSTATPSQGQPQPTQQVKPQAPAQDGGVAKKLEKLDLEKLKANGYGEDELAIFGRFNDLLDENQATREKAERIERYHQEQAQSQHIQEFHVASDTLNEELFGKVYKDGKVQNVSEQQGKNRQKLYETALTMVSGMVSRAQAAGIEPNIPPMPVLLQRVQDFAFANEIKEQARKQQTAAIAEQSKRRRPAAGRPHRTAPTSTGKDTVHPAKAIADSPEVLDLWNKFQEANGAAA